MRPRFPSLRSALGAALGALLPLSVTAGAVQPLWPEAGMPDARPGVAAPCLEWSDAPTARTGACAIIVQGDGGANSHDVAALRPLERKLLDNGMVCVWLRHRPGASGRPAWQDGQRAVRLVRRAAAERGYDPEKIGVLGFSAGARLALLLATSSQTNAYERVDDADDLPCHVNFAIPMSPADVLADDETVDPVFAFDAKTCTTCLFHAGNDAQSPPEGSTRLYRRFRMKRVPAELHLHPDGGHAPPGAEPFERAVEFLRQSGFLGDPGPEVSPFDRWGNNDARATYAKEFLWPEGGTPDPQQAQNAPYIEWHMPKELKTRAIQILYAGGGYGFNNPEDFEVTPTRRYLNERGMAVVTLKYRCPRPAAPLPKHASAWQDLQRAVRLVRAGAAERGLDPGKIGIMGCSAAGHLTLLGATSSRTPAYAPVDDVDALPCNVQWAIAIYPAYALTDGADGINRTGGNDDSAVLVPELAFDRDTCPTLFLHGDADGYAAMNSVKCWEKLRAMGVRSELHTLATRSHTFQRRASPGTGSYTYNDRIWEFAAPVSAIR